MAFTAPGETVPAADSAANLTLRDVVGNKTDTHSGTSLYAVAETLLDHVHSAAKVYPTAAAGVTVTESADTAWGIANAPYAVIVSASTIASPMDIHWINIEDMSAVGTYELILYSGADSSEVEIGRTRSVSTAQKVSSAGTPITTPIIAANSQIKAKLLASTGNGGDITITLGYHTY